jgi:16S rRNA processing protein RimM
MNDNLVSIGKIIGTFGVKGWLKVAPLTDYPERFGLLKKVSVNSWGVVQMMQVEAAKPHQHGYLLKLKGIDSPEEAQILNKSLLQIDESEVHPLPEGVYYQYQLEGLEVYDGKLGRLGILTEILETGANDVYVVDSPRFGEVLIPALKEVIVKVNIEAGRMEVALLPGLVDETKASPER